MRGRQRRAAAPRGPTILTCCASSSASLYTATLRTPRRRVVRMMRQAISPRLATRIFSNIGAAAELMLLCVTECRGALLRGSGRAAHCESAPAASAGLATRAAHSPAAPLPAVQQLQPWGHHVVVGPRGRAASPGAARGRHSGVGRVVGWQLRLQPPSRPACARSETHRATWSKDIMARATKRPAGLCGTGLPGTAVGAQAYSSPSSSDSPPGDPSSSPCSSAADCATKLTSRGVFRP